MEHLVLFSILPIMFYLIRDSKESSISARLVSFLIILTSMGAVVYFPPSMTIIKGFQPVHIIFLLTFVAVVNSRMPSNKSSGSQRYFSLPLNLFIILYLIGFLMTLTGGSSHPFYLSGNTYSNLFIYHLIVPAQILLTGWMVMIVTEKPEDMAIIQKSILIGAIINGFLVAYFYLTEGALSGGWTTYSPGRTAIMKGIGLHSNSIAGVCVYYFIASLMLEEHKAKNLQVVAIGFSLTGTVFTFSRMAWYAVVAIIVLMLPKMRWRLRIIMVIMFLLIWQQMHTQIKNRIRYGKDKQSESATVHEKLNIISAGRIEAVWRPAISQIAKNPIFGTGVFSRVVAGYGTGSAHNAYLKILLNHGIFGLILMSILMINFFLKARKSKHSFYYAVIAMLVMGVVGHLFVPYRGNWLFWILYGLSFNEDHQLTKV